MTIQQLADVHVGHPEEPDEDSIITAQRESFKWGAITILKEFQKIIENRPISSLTIKIEDKIKELSEEV